jgi:hypothetical protein
MASTGLVLENSASTPDLQRIDSHSIQPEEYEEIPELTEADFAAAVIKRPGQPDQPFLAKPPQAT